jgi:holo-[acyl-carrier protein] synthase
MIYGIGIDIIEVERIARAVDRWGEHFLNHVYCPEEIAYAQSYQFPAPHLAGRFAAKEAVIKAVGSLAKFNTWKDIKILNDPQGKPYCLLADPAFNKDILLSISHTKIYAIANAVVTTKPQGL